MARPDDVMGLYPETLTIGNGVIAQILPMPGQIRAMIKYIGGGTLIILGSSLSIGSTYASDNKYIVGATEILNLALSGPIYFQPGGTTTTIAMLRQFSIGMSFLPTTGN